MNEQTKTRESHVNFSQRRRERLKAWADSLVELTDCIARAEALFQQKSESRSDTFFCAYHAR